MTQEDKELLLKDLCARLPYRVKCEVVKYDIYGEMLFIRNGSYAVELTVDNVKELVTNDMYEIKPYLFPISSMTDEQRREYNKLKHKVPVCHWDKAMIDEVELLDSPESYEYLLANHFDDRHFIIKGLAKDATGLNIY